MSSASAAMTRWKPAPPAICSGKEVARCLRSQVGRRAASRARLLDHAGREIDPDEPVDARPERRPAEPGAAAEIEHRSPSRVASAGPADSCGPRRTEAPAPDSPAPRSGLIEARRIMIEQGAHVGGAASRSPDRRRQVARDGAPRHAGHPHRRHARARMPRSRLRRRRAARAASPRPNQADAKSGARSTACANRSAAACRSPRAARSRAC